MQESDKSILDKEYDELTTADITSDEYMQMMFEETNDIYLQRNISEARALYKRKGGSLKDFDDLIKLYKRKRKAEAWSLRQERRTEFGYEYLPELKSGQYNCTESGVSYLQRTGNGESVQVNVINQPLTIARLLSNIDTGTNYVEIVFKTPRKWVHKIAERKTLSKRNDIVDLANSGLMVNSENAPHVIKYLSDLESYNQYDLPNSDLIDRLGWVQDIGFVPYVEGVYYHGTEKRKLFDAVHVNGEQEQWLKIMRDLRLHAKPSIKISLAVSLASVLVGKIGSHIPFIEMLYGTTGKGKTVTLKIAATIWGNPDDMISSANSTMNSIEYNCGLLHDVPLILDEVEQLQRDPDKFTQMIYQLTEGKGKGRLTRYVTERKTNEWSNATILTGESRITEGIVKGGAINRVIEVPFEENPCDGPKQLGEYLDDLRHHYGFAGKIFTDKLQQPGKLQEAEKIYDYYLKELLKHDVTGKHAIIGAIILAADRLSDAWIYDDMETLDVEDISKLLVHNSDVDVGLKALTFVDDWVSQKQNLFINENDSSDTWPRGDVYGVITREEKYYINQVVLNRVLTEHGFAPEVFAKYAVGIGRLERDTDGRHYAKRKRVNNKTTRCYCLISAKEPEPVPDEPHPFA